MMEAFATFGLCLFAFGYAIWLRGTTKSGPVLMIYIALLSVALIAYILMERNKDDVQKDVEKIMEKNNFV